MKFPSSMPITAMTPAVKVRLVNCFCSILFFVFSIHTNGYWSVVYQFHFHLCTKFACAHGFSKRLAEAGAEFFVYMESGASEVGSDFTVKSEKEIEVAAGEELAVGIPSSACHLFNADGIAFPRTAVYKRN